MPTYNFKYFESVKHQEHVASILNGLPDIWPSWVETVYICDHGADEDKPRQMACCIPQPERRRVEIGVNPPFYQQDEEEQVRVLLHEICHCLIGPLVEWMFKDVFPAIDQHNPALSAIFERQFNRLWESTAVDFEHIAIRALSSPR